MFPNVHHTRISKDLSYYEKEAAKQQERIDKLVADGADEHDIRKQKEVLEETNQMLPESKKRLAAAYKELADLVEKYVSAAGSEEVAPEEVLAAQTVLQEVRV
ncbi:hypothetical protein SpCBS45565_g02456 [Spizellomyces sp. 'palustris']|nr:hypothetical protein SpCBS45565_g02456 [Spizellomyces sp. 'palustris']